MSDAEKNLVTCCGLYCGDCYAHTGELAELAQALRDMLHKHNFEKVAEVIPFEEFTYYKECAAFLRALVALRCQQTCRGGGGNPLCEIRACCQEKGRAGCWECEQMEGCSKLKLLEPVHRDANIKNLRNIKKEGIDKWTTKKRYW